MVVDLELLEDFVDGTFGDFHKSTNRGRQNVHTLYT